MTVFAQKLTQSDQLLEFGQIHRGNFTLLFLSSQEHPRPQGAQDFFATHHPFDHVLKGYNKQLSKTLEYGLLILECDNFSTLYQFIFGHKQLLQENLLEISRSALPNGKATALFVNVKNFDQKALPQDLSATFIAQPGPQLLSLFSF